MKGYKELSADAVTEITLLSVEEYKAAQEHIPPLNEWWWLRSPGYSGFYAACVFDDGSIYANGRRVDYIHAVRPALRLDPESFNLRIGDKFRFSGRRWTYIAEGLALSDKAFCEMSFREDRKAKDANIYEASDVKAYLDGWLEDHTEGRIGKVAGEEPGTNTQKELSANAVRGITLLSIEEYKEAQEHIPLLDDWWWLRSPGNYSNNAALVKSYGSVLANGNYVNFSYAVRPVLRLDRPSVDLRIGDRFRFGGKRWTYIAEGLALSDEAFCSMPFRRDWKAEDANVYEASDVKAYLDYWWFENITKTQTGKAADERAKKPLFCIIGRTGSGKSTLEQILEKEFGKNYQALEASETYVIDPIGVADIRKRVKYRPIFEIYVTAKEGVLEERLANRQDGAGVVEKRRNAESARFDAYELLKPWDFLVENNGSIENLKQKAARIIKEADSVLKSGIR